MRKTAVKRERMRMRLIIFASATYVRQLLQVTCYRCMRREDLHGSSDRFGYVTITGSRGAVMKQRCVNIDRVWSVDN